MNHRTPLYAHHCQLGARMAPFAGYDMPIEYTGIIAEHTAVRTAAGLFDVSHMGEIECNGPGATALLQWLTPNDVALLGDGTAQYSMLLNERGGIIDDIIIYRHAADYYLIVINAANAETDWHWLLAHQRGDVTLRNVSETWCLIALQGPRAIDILRPLTNAPLDTLKPFHFCYAYNIGDCGAIIARTGYTGESGVECFVSATHAPQFWSTLIEAGKAHGLQPCGLGARDTLRLEMGYRLHGHDMNEQCTPFEAGLDWVVKMTKGDFLGRAALQQQQQEGCKRRLVGFQLIDPGIPREGYSIVAQRKPVGYVTSGTMSPTLRKGIGLGYVPVPFVAAGTKFSVDIRGKERLAEVVDVPFYHKNSV